MKEYIYGLGMLMSDVRVDQQGRLFILVEGQDNEGQFCYKEIAIPEEYQTLENINLIKNL